MLFADKKDQQLVKINIKAALNGANTTLDSVNKMAAELHWSMSQKRVLHSSAMLRLGSTRCLDSWRHETIC